MSKLTEVEVEEEPSCKAPHFRVYLSWLRSLGLLKKLDITLETADLHKEPLERVSEVEARIPKSTPPPAAPPHLQNERTVTMKNFNWTGGLFLIGYHILLLVSLPLYLLYMPLNPGLMVAAFVLYVLAAMGITAGYHRFYSHKTYKPHKPLEAVLLSMGTLAIQGSALEWSHDHRLHHRHVDTDEDPYQTRDGFWYSHLLWMFKKRKPLQEQGVADLMENSLVHFQHRHYGLLVAATNMIPVVFLGWLFEDYIGAFVIALLARIFLVHHSTWFINSLAHMWGSKPFSTEHSAVNNWILSLFTMGEGYHNYHHTFSGDYRNGVRWYQYDITKLLIWLAGQLGLASDLRRVRTSTIRKKLILVDRKLMLRKIREKNQPALNQLEKEIVKIADSLVAKLSDWENLVNNLRSQQKARNEGLRRRVRVDLLALKKSIREESRSWTRLCRQVLETPVVSSQS
ncbi:MAG: acyl-CoA desaturase [Acidobacteriota bacterium]